MDPVRPSDDESKAVGFLDTNAADEAGPDLHEREDSFLPATLSIFNQWRIFNFFP
jgi:hypothetical protein